MAFFGISARNNEQKAVMQALLNDKPFTFITGPAGCGKTIIPQAYGLEKTVEDRDYQRFIYTRMQIQVGENLGALPGDLGEKNYPFVAPFMDNLRVMSSDYSNIKRYILEGDEDKRKIFFDPIQTIRGRSLDHTFLLADEVQNLDVHSMAAIATRPALNVKMVFVGNFSQIDKSSLRNPKTNGLFQLLEGLYEKEAFEYFDHINLRQQQRHPVVSLVEEILREHDLPEAFTELEERGNVYD